MCSDGLNGMLDDQQISDLLISHSSPDETCETLVEAAKNAGGRDNITTLVIDVTD